MKKKFPRVRYCKRCNELFSATSKYSRICNRCNLNNCKITNKHIISLSNVEITNKYKVGDKNKKARTRKRN